jgi:thymidylate kinase
VLDRFVDSSLAYQGFARDLGIDAVLELNGPGLQGVLPDVTFVIDVDPAVALGAHGRRARPHRARGARLPGCACVRASASWPALPGARAPVDGERAPNAIAADIAAQVDELLESPGV